MKAVLVTFFFAAVNSFDLCIIGDSTLQMFASAWMGCKDAPNDTCAFVEVAAGTYFTQTWLGRTFERKTKLVRSTHFNCTVMFADFHATAWLHMVQQFWNARGYKIACRRTITNFHHHAYAYFKLNRTIPSVTIMMNEVERAAREYLFASEPIAWFLPTMPADNNVSFPQTVTGVIETSILMSATGVETIPLLQLLSMRLHRIGNQFGDRLHTKAGVVLNDSFSTTALRNFLRAEFRFCSRRS